MLKNYGENSSVEVRERGNSLYGPHMRATQFRVGGTFLFRPGPRLQTKVQEEVMEEWRLQGTSGTNGERQLVTREVLGREQCVGKESIKLDKIVVGNSKVDVYKTITDDRSIGAVFEMMVRGKSVGNEFIQERRGNGLTQVAQDTTISFPDIYLLKTNHNLHESHDKEYGSKKVLICLK
ncbi:hypothetical protein REPUB_Repub11eG0110700 [Reevesia pubescens]